jgi:hypothetical protein
MATDSSPNSSAGRKYYPQLQELADPHSGLEDLELKDVLVFLPKPQLVGHFSPRKYFSVLEASLWMAVSRGFVSLQCPM